MRKLCNQNSVSEEYEGASKFLQLRDETRKNALIYTDTLLPTTETAVEKIRDFAVQILVSDFDDWHGDLEEIKQGAVKAEFACNLLLHFYEKLITEMKQKEDSATLNKKDLERLKKIYEEDKQTLLDAAEEHKRKMERYQRLGLILALPTLGIGTWVAKTKAKKEQQSMNENLEKAKTTESKGGKLKETGDLADSLFPVFSNFVKGLTACGGFLKRTRVELSALNEKGREGQEAGWKKRTENLLKRHAKELDTKCMGFISNSTEIRTNLMAIPSEPSDKNYVQQWLADQLTSFQSLNNNGPLQEEIAILGLTL